LTTRAVTNVVVAAFGLLCLNAAPARAQQPIQDVISFLLTNQAVVTGDVVKDAESVAITRDTLTRSLLNELTTLPLASSSSAFIYRFNPVLGTIDRASDNFGPFFTERSLTTGRRNASLGITVHVARYDTLDGHDLRDGSFVTTANQFRDEPEPFETDTLTLRLDTRTVTLLGSVGLTDRLDIGGAVPVVSLSLDGLRISTYRGARFLQATATATAVGFGDVAIRSKLRLVGQRLAAAALIGELRLPTGRERDLLGAGEASMRALFSASFQPRRFAIDGNVGVAVGGISRELDYRASASLSVSPRMTIVGELLGRRIADLGVIAEARAPHPTTAGVDTTRLISAGDDTSTAAVLAGLKWNAFGAALMNANVTWSLTDRGLRAPLIARLGVDFAFVR